MPRFAYNGVPPRAGMVVELRAPDGSTRRLEAVADTGNPLPLIVGDQFMDEFRHLHRVTDAIRGSHPGIQALVGLPLLRKLQFGGNAVDFWISD